MQEMANQQAEGKVVWPDVGFFPASGLYILREVRV